MKRASRSLLSLLPHLTVLVVSCGPPSSDVVVVVPGSQGAPAFVETAAPAAAAPKPAAPPRAIAWETDRSVARERARTRGAPMLVFAFAEWATAAVRMERATWADPRVLRAARSFVALRLDLTAADATAQVGADDLALGAIPTLVILDELGREIARVEGYAGPDEVLARMGRAVPGAVPGD